MELLKIINNLTETMFEFLNNYVKTSITSIGSISFGLILDIAPNPTTTIQLLQEISLGLGCVVALFAITNGVFKLIENINKIHNKNGNRNNK